MPSTTLNAAAEILQKAATSDLDRVEKDRLVDEGTRTTVLPLEATRNADWLETEAIHLLCSPVRWAAMSNIVEGQERFNANALAARNVLCGARGESGQIIFFDDLGPTTPPISESFYLNLRESERAVAEITSEINRLRQDLSLQTELVQQLTRMTGERNFDDRLDALRKAKAEAEAAAEKPGLFEVAKTVFNVATAVSIGIGAFEAIDDVFDGLSGISGLAGQFDHLWDNRKKLGKQAGVIGKQAGVIAKGISLFDKPSGSAVQQLEQQIQVVTEQRRAFLEEMGRFRDVIMERRSSMDRLLVRRQSILNQEPIAEIADSTVSRNIFAFSKPLSQSGGERLERCSRLLSRDGLETGMPSYGDYQTACLTFAVSLAERQKCALSTGRISDVAVLPLGGFAAFLTRSSSAACLDIN